MSEFPRLVLARIAPRLRRSQALLAAITCGIALAGAAVVISSNSTASAASSPWSLQGIPSVSGNTPNAQFEDVSCPTISFCMAVGRYLGTDGVQRTLAEKWTGGSWHTVSSANPAGAQVSELGSVSCLSATACEAVGGSGGLSARSQTLLAERWNGTAWTIVPIQKPGSTTLDGLSCATSSFCVTVGFRTTTDGSSQAVAERWNGHQWLIITPARPRHVTNLQGVSCPSAHNCYAVGGQATSTITAGHPLVEHWNGSRWTTQHTAEPTGAAELSAISCARAATCTAVGSAGTANTRMLVEDLARGRWTEGLPSAPRLAEPGMYAVSCSAPRVCTALVSYIGSGEVLTWATAFRGATGGFKVGAPVPNAAFDTGAAVSCRPVACEVVGALNSRDGRGDQTGTGTTAAWRGNHNHFTRQSSKNPAGTAGGSLTGVSCVASGFCAATDSITIDSVPAGAVSVLDRAAGSSHWSAPPNQGSGFLSGISCTSASFCLALGSPAGAETWDGSTWSELTAPDAFTPNSGGLQAVTCVSDTDCMAVGSTLKGLKGQALVATWDGSTWTTSTPALPVGSVNSVLAGLSCTSATNCVAAGSYATTAGGTYHALIETWDGSAWTIASATRPVDGAFIDHVSVSCATASACMVTWGSSVGEALADWWNGSTWTATTFPGPTAHVDERWVYGVSCTSATFCTAVGGFIYPNAAGPLVDTWNGTTWTADALPATVGVAEFNAVSCATGGACTAVGDDQRLVTVPFAEARS